MVGNISFMDKYPSLYNIVRKRTVSVAVVMSYVPLNVSFRRVLVSRNLANWHNLVSSIVHIQLNDEYDSFRWNIHQIGQISVRSIYLALINNDHIVGNKVLWKLKMPLKIKIFMRYLFKGLVLTKDNLARRIGMAL